MIDVRHLLFAIKSGADGVMVVGWRPNECQFKIGNFTAQKHVDFAKRILSKRGFGDQRINMYWLSSAEGEKFVKSVEDTYEKVKRLGVNPLRAVKAEAIQEKARILTNPGKWFL